MDTVCVFCMGVFVGDTIFCVNCDDYKGLMPFHKAEEYLGVKLEVD